MEFPFTVIESTSTSRNEFDMADGYQPTHALFFLKKGSFEIEKKLKGNFEKKNCDKAIRFLIYRGYDLSDIKNAIERLKTDEI